MRRTGLCRLEAPAALTERSIVSLNGTHCSALLPSDDAGTRSIWFERLYEAASPLWSLHGGAGCVQRLLVSDGH